MARLAAAAALAVCGLFGASQLAQAAPVSVGHSGWGWGDPQPQGNTLNGIGFTGTRGYAAGDFGTLLRTDDAGASWQGIPTGITDPLMAVRVIDANTVVIGGGCALRRSTDGGQSFTRLPWTATDETCPSPIATYAFPNAAVGYLITESGSVLRTTDGGQTFAGKAAVPGSPSVGGARTPTDVFFSSDDTGFVTTSASGEGKVFKTVNGGDSWAQVGTGGAPLNGLVFVGGSGYAVGNGTTLLRSDDGGDTWLQKALTGVPPGLGLTSITCADATTCLATESSGGAVVRTIDGGDNGTAITPSTEKVFAAAFSSATRAVGVGNRGATVVSDTAGAMWSPVGGHISGSGLRGLRASSSEIAQAGADDGTLARTTDGGVNWFTVGVPTTGAIKNASFPTQDTGYAIDDLGGAFKTINGGASWQILNTVTTSIPEVVLAVDTTHVLLVGPTGLRSSTDGGGSFAAVKDKDVAKASLADIDAAGPALVVSGRKALAVSNDGGGRWKSLKRPKGRIDDADFVSAKLGYAFTTDGRVWRTKNGGKKWTDLPAIGTDLGSGLSFSSAGAGYLSTFGFGSEKFGYVLRTTDAGKSWQPQLVAQDFVNVWDAGQTGFAVTFATFNTPGGDFLETPTGGQAGTPSSLTIKKGKAKSATAAAAKKQQVKISGKLSPAGGGEQIVVSIRKGSNWSSQTVAAASNGGFTAKLTVKKTSFVVAQWAGDDDRSGAGTKALKVKPPKK